VAPTAYLTCGSIQAAPDQNASITAATSNIAATP